MQIQPHNHLKVLSDEFGYIKAKFETLKAALALTTDSAVRAKLLRDMALECQAAQRQAADRFQTALNRVKSTLH